MSADAFNQELWDSCYAAAASGLLSGAGLDRIPDGALLAFHASALADDLLAQREASIVKRKEDAEAAKKKAVEDEKALAAAKKSELESKAAFKKEAEKAEKLAAT